MELTTWREMANTAELVGEADALDDDAVIATDKGDPNPDGGRKETEHGGANEGPNDGSKEEKEAEESSGERP
jgi:hypothetical protein